MMAYLKKNMRKEKIYELMEYLDCSNQLNDSDNSFILSLFIDI